MTCSTKEPWDAAPSGEVTDLVQCMRQIHQAGCWDGPNLSDFDGETSDAGWPPQQKWRSMWPSDSLWYLWYTFYSNCIYFLVPCQMYAAAHKSSWRYLTCIFPGFPFPVFSERLCLESLNSSQLEDIFGIDLPYLCSKFCKSGYQPGSIEQNMREKLWKIKAAKATGLDNGYHGMYNKKQNNPN